MRVRRFLRNFFRWLTGQGRDEGPSGGYFASHADNTKLWRMYDRMISDGSCSPEAKRRLRDVIHNYRGGLRRLQNAMNNGDRDEHARVQAELRVWLDEIHSLTTGPGP